MSNPLATPFPLTHRPRAAVSFETLQLLALTIAIGVLFFVISHSLTYTQRVTYDYAPSSEDSAAAVQDGSAVRKIGYLALGAIGFVLLTRRLGRRFTFNDPLAMAFLAYWVFCLASVARSIDTSLTLRRVIVLSCCMFAVFGIVRQLRKEDIVKLAFFLSLAFVLAGLAAEIALGAFRPWSSGYRFSGTVHPNSQGQLCALLCLSAYAWLRTATRGRWMLAAAMAFALAVLLLTKSRSSCLAIGVGLLVIWLPFARRERIALASFAAPFVACVLILFAAFVGFDIEGGVGKTLTLGRDGSVGSFTGRVPLWLEIAPHALERPLLGHGYLSFWTPWRIKHTSELFEWTIPDAHNEYLETLLNLGLFGALVLAVVVFGCMLRAFRAYLRSGDVHLGFFAAQLLIALVCGLFESGFAQPMGLVSFFTVCGAVYVACRMPAEKRDTGKTANHSEMPTAGGVL